MYSLRNLLNLFQEKGICTYHARNSTNEILRNFGDLKTSITFPLCSTCSHFSSNASFFISSNNFCGKVSLLNVTVRLMIASA
jgi:hypothetical protein